MTTIVDYSAVTSDILSLLVARFGKLPVQGVIAGQAVAEAFFQIMCIPVKSRMKDLDVFLLPSMDASRAKSAVHYRRGVDTISNVSPVSIIGVEDSYDDGSGSFNTIEKLGYSVIGSQSDGDINFVFVSTNTFSAKSIVDGFDLNISQIGIDAYSKQMYMSDDFIRFTKDRILRVSNFSTPAGTLMRLLEKSKFDGVLVDKENAINSLSLAVALRQAANGDGYAIGTGLTDVRYSRLIMEKDFWIDSFDIEVHSFEREEYASADPSFKVFQLVAKFVPDWLRESSHISSELLYAMSFHAGKLLAMSDFSRGAFVSNLLFDYGVKSTGRSLCLSNVTSVVTLLSDMGNVLCDEDRQSMSIAFSTFQYIFGRDFINTFGNFNAQLFLQRLVIIDAANRWDLLSSLAGVVVYGSDVSFKNLLSVSAKTQLDLSIAGTTVIDNEWAPKTILVDNRDFVLVENVDTFIQIADDRKEYYALFRDVFLSKRTILYMASPVPESRSRYSLLRYDVSLSCGLNSHDENGRADLCILELMNAHRILSDAYCADVRSRVVAFKKVNNWNDSPVRWLPVLHAYDPEDLPF